MTPEENKDSHEETEDDQAEGYDEGDENCWKSSVRGVTGNLISNRPPMDPSIFGISLEVIVVIWQWHPIVQVQVGGTW